MSIIYLWTVKFAGTSRPHLNLQQLRGLRLLFHSRLVFSSEKP